MGLFVVLCGLFLPTVSAGPSLDVWSADLAAWHIAQTGDPTPDITAYPELDDNSLRDVWVVQNADGVDTIGRAPGVIAAGVPAYVIARLLGSGEMSAVPGGIAAAILVAFGAVLFQRTLRDRLGERHALLAAVLLATTTPLWTVAADGMWPHTLTVFGILGMAWAAERERWWLVGLFGGVALWGRLHAALICAVVGVAVAIVRRQPGVAVRTGVASGSLMALMSVWTHWMYGSWNPTSAYRVKEFTDHAGGNRFDFGNHLGLWVAPDRGILVWTPTLLLLVPAMVRSWRTLPDWSRALVVSGFIYSVAQTTLNRFSGGDAFYGYRVGLEMLACLAPAAALASPMMGRIARRAFVPIAVIQWLAMIPGAIAGSKFALPVDDAWHRNAFVASILDYPEVVMVLLLPGILVAALVITFSRDDALHERLSCGSSRKTDHAEQSV